MEEVAAELSGAKVFSVLDEKSTRSLFSNSQNKPLKTTCQFRTSCVLASGLRAAKSFFNCYSRRSRDSRVTNRYHLKICISSCSLSMKDKQDLMSETLKLCNTVSFT